jgi:hypothetical protein
LDGRERRLSGTERNRCRLLEQETIHKNPDRSRVTIIHLLSRAIERVLGCTGNGRRGGRAWSPIESNTSFESVTPCRLTARKVWEGASVAHPYRLPLPHVCNQASCHFFAFRESPVSVERNVNEGRKTSQIYNSHYIWSSVGKKLPS